MYFWCHLRGKIFGRIHLDAPKICLLALAGLFLVVLLILTGVLGVLIVLLVLAGVLGILLEFLSHVNILLKFSVPSIGARRYFVQRSTFLFIHLATSCKLC